MRYNVDQKEKDMSKIESQRSVRHYDEDFKRRAVNLYKTSNKSYQVLASELGIPMSTLVGWIRHSERIISNVTHAELEPDLLKDIKAVRRELAVVKEERDILKKALAIFSINGQSK